jgi:2-polyprenyl-3-methyl-5-hydroxy-6-metoxy-1,4-benzoquinol methylase
MSYKDFQKERWNMLAREFGGTEPLRAVISRDSDQVNYYFDKTSRRILEHSLRLEHKRVLDLGCGVGRLTVWLARKAQHVTGVDISEEMIRVAQSAAASEGLRNVTFQVYDGTTLLYGDASFDVIVCVGVLKYIVDEADFFRVIGEMCRTVASGGQIAVVDQFDYAGPVKLSGGEDLGGLSVLRRPTDYISLFQKHGLELIEQCSIFRKRFQAWGATVLTRLPLGRFIVAQPLVVRAMAAVDVRIDEVLRYRVKPIRGFQLLRFVRRS